MGRQNAHGIAAKAKECRMAKADQPAEAKRDVQPNPRQRKDCSLGRQRDDERLIQRKGRKCRGGQQQKKEGVKNGFAGHLTPPQRGRWV